MAQATERTRLLLDDSKPQYVFDSSIIRERKRRVRQFQCCLCVIFICTFTVALVVTISYSLQFIGGDDNSAGNETSSNNTGADDAVSQSLIVLLSKSWPIPDEPQENDEFDNATVWMNAMKAGEKALLLRDEAEKLTPSPARDSASYKHQKVVATSEKARNLSRIGYKEEYATRSLSSMLKNRKVCYKGTEFCNSSIITQSSNARDCLSSRYRTYDGSCNNLKNPQFGTANIKFRRALPPDYGDGISEPRLGVDGNTLPSARTVSLIVHPPYNKDNEKFSVVLAVWGQFLDHDITNTALSQGLNGTPISCCTDQKPLHPECFPVYLDELDPNFVNDNLTCMEFVRSAPAPTCCLGPREQLTQVTAFIDGSVIYGGNSAVAEKLRKKSGGELEMYVTEDNRTLLPSSKDPGDGCNRLAESKKGRYCFLAGDVRANENLHLTSMHLIWARHHNLIASKLGELNPHWDDERIFQEARKMIGAQMQHITYNEFLPILLGDRLMTELGLKPQSSGFFQGYDENVDASIANNFATAAFRFAHSIIPALMKMLSNDTSSPEYVQTHKLLLDPFALYQPGELDRALRGAMDTTIQANDRYFTKELKNLFESDNGGPKKSRAGLDLVSLNIQRGRDHGLVGYNSWREHCGLRRARSFDQLQEDLDGDSLANIRSIYRSVEDVDLYTGALSERPIAGSILGPTLTCLILDQFVRIKVGDRLWYENPRVFAPGQLEQIRKTSLARIFCDNSDGVEFSQRLVMEKVRADNPVIPCPDLSGPDLGPWQENFSRVLTPTDEVRVGAVH